MRWWWNRQWYDKRNGTRPPRQNIFPFPLVSVAMMGVTLEDLAVGESGRVVAISGPNDVRQRLMEMGLTPGAMVKIVRFAPLGDPIDVELRGYHLSLRKHEAAQVQIRRK